MPEQNKDRKLFDNLTNVRHNAALNVLYFELLTECQSTVILNTHSHPNKNPVPFGTAHDR